MGRKQVQAAVNDGMCVKLKGASPKVSSSDLLSTLDRTNEITLRADPGCGLVTLYNKIRSDQSDKTKGAHQRGCGPVSCRTALILNCVAPATDPRPKMLAAKTVKTHLTTLTLGSHFFCLALS